MDKFWMVWNPAAKTPQYRHPNQKAAKVEAEKLAAANPNNQFYVLEALSFCEKRDILWTELSDELPF